MAKTTKRKTAGKNGVKNKTVARLKHAMRVRDSAESGAIVLDRLWSVVICSASKRRSFRVRDVKYSPVSLAT